MYLQQTAWEQAESDLRQSLHYCEMLDLPWEKGHTLYYLGNSINNAQMIYMQKIQPAIKLILAVQTITLSKHEAFMNRSVQSQHNTRYSKHFRTL